MFYTLDNFKELWPCIYKNIKRRVRHIKLNNKISQLPYVHNFIRNRKLLYKQKLEIIDHNINLLTIYEIIFIFCILLIYLLTS